MKKQIRYYFTDFWSSFDFKDCFWYIFSEYDLILDKERPDYLFYSCFGTDHLLYDRCVKIFWSGENMIPDLNICDYAFSLSNIQCDDRTFRLRSEGMYRAKGLFETDLKEEMLLHRKFCNFVYGNNRCADPYRLDFYKKLSGYKKIDSAGSLMNNMNGFKVPECESKLSFISKYKFTIAIENSSQNGYSTEKIVEPFLARTLPIYWGDPNINQDYNPDSFVNLMSFSSIDDAVEEIIRLDQDDEAYLQKIQAPFWPYGNSFEEFCNCELKKIMAFWHHIFDQPKEKAYRRTMYGNSKMYVNRKILEKRMNMKIKSIGLDNRLIRSVMTRLLK